MRSFIIVGCAAALIACGGRTDAQHGLEGPTSAETAVAYPSGDYGYDVGEIIPNVAFLGYEHLDPSTVIDTKTAAIGSVRFSDFYDPNGERGLTYLYVSVEYMWCAPSNEEEDFINGGNWAEENSLGVSFATKYAAKGVRFMTLLADGPTFGTDATVMDLTNWVERHESRDSEGLLPREELALNVLGPTGPYNMIVDVRTMRVVDVEIGFDSNFTKLASLLK